MLCDLKIVNNCCHSANPVEKTLAIQVSTSYVTTQALYAKKHSHSATLREQRSRLGAWESRVLIRF